MRLFLALELPDIVRQRLTKLSKTTQEYWADELAERGIAGREVPAPSWVRPENLHVTLKFFGEVPDSDLPVLCRALEGAHGAGIIRLVPDRTVCLPPRGPIRVISVGLSGELERLHQIHRQIEEWCEPIGFRPERRPLTPHITVSRVKGWIPSYMREKLKKIGSVHLPAPQFDVCEFVLMQSHLDPKGARYVPAARFPLQAPGS